MKILRGAEWQSTDLRGQRIAIIASAAEVGWILPEIVETAATVKVFQSSADWITAEPARLPRRLRRIAARRHLRKTISDPWVRRQLRPPRRRERVAVRPGFYAALQHPNCKLYTWPVYAVTDGGVRSAEGVEHLVDVLIVGTEVSGLGGDSASSSAPAP